MKKITCVGSSQKPLSDKIFLHIVWLETVAGEIKGWILMILSTF